MTGFAPWARRSRGRVLGLRSRRRVRGRGGGRSTGPCQSNLRGVSSFRKGKQGNKGKQRNNQNTRKGEHQEIVHSASVRTVPSCAKVSGCFHQYLCPSLPWWHSGTRVPLHHPLSLQACTLGPMGWWSAQKGGFRSRTTVNKCQQLSRCHLCGWQHQP